MKILFSIALSMCALTSFAQIKVSNYNDSISGGIVYSLPKKSFIVEVHYTETTKAPGIYSEFATEMLDVNDIITQKSTSYSIKDITVRAITEPDYDARFVAKNNVSRDEKKFYINTDSQGIIKSIGSGANDESLQNCNGDFSSCYSNYNAANSMNLYRIVPAEEYYSDTVYKDEINSFEYEIVSSVEEIPLRDRAEEAMENMLNARQQRLDLISGYQEVAYSKETLDYMQKSLLEVEKSYLEMFIGSTTDKDYVYSFVYSPSIENAHKDVGILCFSEETGICNSSRAGTQITFLAKPRNNDNVGKVKNLNNNEIYYRNPVASEVQVKYNNKIYAGGIYSIPQFGRLVSVDISRCKRATFDTQTGSVINFEME